MAHQRVCSVYGAGHITHSRNTSQTAFHSDRFVTEKTLAIASNSASMWI